MISSFSVKKPFTVVVAIIIVLILGVVSYSKMTVDLIPSMNLPYAVVVTAYPGASPEQVETIVTDNLEQSLATVDNIKQLRSVSSENMSIIILEFEDDTDMNAAMLGMRENLDIITAYFPDEIGTPMIMKINPDMLPVEVLSVSAGGMTDSEAARLIEERIIPELKSVEGIAAATTTGLIEDMCDVTVSGAKVKQLNKDISDYAQSKIDEEVAKQVDIIYDEQVEALKKQTADMEALIKAYPEQAAALMSQAGEMPTEEDIKAEIEKQIRENLPETEIPDVDITVDMITGILKAQNFSMPAGTVYTSDGTSDLLRVGEKYASREELENQVIYSVEGYGDICIKDVCEVIFYDNTSEIYSRVNGDYAVMVALSKQPNYSTADVTDRVSEKLDELRNEYEGVDFAELMNQGTYVNLMIGSIINNLLMGAALAVVVLIIFLRRIKPTVIVALSIVISVITAFVLMYFSGITLNMISMGGLALGVGMLVDNSIVVIENIFRMRSEGKTAFEAAIEGAKEVAGAITASTLTTVVVFVPIAFTSGLTRQLFTDMALTIAFSLIASLAVALTLVPAAASRFLGNAEKDAKPSKIGNVYAKALAVTLRHKAPVIIMAVVLLGASLYAAVSSGAELFPSTDSGQLMVSVTMPEEYTNEERFAELDTLGEILLAGESVKTVGIMDTTDSSAAEASLMSMAGSSITVYVLLDEERSVTTDKISSDIRSEIAASDLKCEVEISSAGLDMSMLTGSAVDIMVLGSDLDSIREGARIIGEAVAEVDGTYEVSNGLEKTSEEIRVVVDKNAAGSKGLTVAQVYAAVSAETASASSVTELADSGVEYSVYVRDDRVDDIVVSDLENIEIENMTGEKVKLSDVAKVVTAEGFSSINRMGQERVVSVTASLDDGYDVTAVNGIIEDKLSSLSLPEGVRYEIAGESQSIKDTFTDLLLMLLLAVIFIYLVMVAQFQSLLSPFIVMFTIPLAFTGGFGAMFISGAPVSAITLIGLVILVGIVVNNGIVFVDYANKQVEKGMEVTDALILTGRNRIRPILMTALTTIVALVVMAFDTSTGSEMLRPMAVTTIGGMIYSTLLTLFLIPAMYAVFRRKSKKEGSKVAE